MAGSSPTVEGVTTDPGSTGRNSLVWPTVVAMVAAIAVIAYLIHWGRRYGLDLRVYRVR